MDLVGSVSSRTDLEIDQLHLLLFFISSSFFFKFLNSPLSISIAEEANQKINSATSATKLHFWSTFVSQSISRVLGAMSSQLDNLTLI